jgi:hypothetical protein
LAQIVVMNLNKQSLSTSEKIEKLEEVKWKIY